MDRIALAGLSLRDVDVEGLERAKRRAAERESALAREIADHLGASELVLISTCNRIEVAYAREEGHLPSAQDLGPLSDALGLAPGSELRARLTLATGRDAARRLLRIACSLDSLVVGEAQILAQVRAAFERAEASGLGGPLLAPLFQHAVQVGKQVRTETEIARHPVSVASIAAELVARRFEGSRPRVAALGAGEMARLFARSLRDRGLAVDWFVNRSPERARALAQELGGRALDLSAFLSGAERADVLFSATSAPGVVVEARALRALAASAPLGRGLYALDVAVPRDLEPCADLGVEVVDLDALRAVAEENRARRAHAAAEAEALVEAKLDTWARRFGERQLAATLDEMRLESDRVLERELRGLRAGAFARLAADDRAALERWARTAFGRLAHVPIAALKRFAGSRARDDAEKSP